MKIYLFFYIDELIQISNEPLLNPVIIFVNIAAF